MNTIKKLIKEKKKAIENGSFKEAAAACNALGNEYKILEKYEDALQEHLEEHEFCQMAEDELGMAVANRGIGECYANLNKFNKALHHIRKFYDLSVKLNSAIEEQRAWMTFGRTYYMKYQHDFASGSSDDKSLSKTLNQAELAYYRALKLLPKINLEGNPAELAAMKCRALLNLGLVCELREDDHEKSSRNMKDAMDIALENNLHEDICRCGFNLGTLYQRLEKHVEAEIVFNKALTAIKKVHDKNLKSEILLSKGINLICLEKYNEAKKCLKSAYKLNKTNSNPEDFEKVTKSLKVCIGISNCEAKLKSCEDLYERKILLEKIADGLASINCFALAIKKYHMTLDCMINSSLSEKAPILFSLAQTYLDNNNVKKALDYFEKEYNCNIGKPLEQIQTLWKIAEILEKEKETDKSEEFYLKAVSLAKNADNKKYIYNSLSKLQEFYMKSNKTNFVEKIKQEINNISDDLSAEESVNEENEEPFNDISLSELSDDNNYEEITARNRKRTRKIESKVNEKGETPLHLACINNNFTLVKRLVENGHSVNIRDGTGWTPLHEACNYGCYDIVEFLIENGADVNDAGCDGITPLHDAASCGHFDVMWLLLSKGAKVTALDKEGKTPLDIVLQWKNEYLKFLDDITLKQCKAIEEELKLEMAKCGMNFSEKVTEDLNSPDLSDINHHQNTTISGKRNRSCSSSSNNDSNEDEDKDMEISPYLTENETRTWNDAETEYKSVMENLRRSAANIKSPIKSDKPKINVPPLLDENEIVKEWLVKDTGKIPRKKRRLNKLNVRTSKCIDKFLIPQDSPEEKASISFSDDSNSSITIVNSVDSNTTKNNCQEQQSCVSQKSEFSAVTFCLRVNIAGKLILVPVPEDTYTINWLKEEAASRFQAIDGSKPHLILTKNNALLSDADLIKNIFSNNEEVLSSVEMWDEPSLDDKYVQLCNKHNETMSSDIRKRFCKASSTSFELNLADCSISYTHLSIIFHTLLNYKSLKHLNLSCTFLSTSNISEFISCIPNLSTLLTLNLSCCSLTSDKIQIFLDYLNDQVLKTTVLPSLKNIDLSHNCFSDCPDFTVLLKLNYLSSLNLCSCELDTTFLSGKFLEALENKENLEDIDISGNIFKGNDISKFVHHLPKKNLKKLNLRYVVEKEEGLGIKLQLSLMQMLPNLMEISLQDCFLTDTDLNIISTFLTYFPELQIIDLSANPLLSTDCVISFIKKLHESNLNVTHLNITGTCNWESDHLASLTDCLKLKTLKHFCFNNCPESMIQTIMQSWTEKLGSKALCTNNFFFCELSVK